MKVRLICLVMFFIFSRAEASDSFKSLHLVSGCSIYSTTGVRLIAFPGLLCLFREDGSFLSAGFFYLKYFDKNNKLIWQIRRHFHHELKFSEDGKRILTLSSEIIERNKVKYRMDKFIVISLDGKIIFEQTADVLLAKYKKDWISYPVPLAAKEQFGISFEMSHFNSFSEIPKNDREKTVPYLKRGNYIVNGLSHGVFILSADLKEVLHHLDLQNSHQNLTHDVQVNKRGNLLYFNNTNVNSKDGDAYSSVDEYDPIENKVVFEFTSPIIKTLFFSKCCGGVQELDDEHLLFSDSYNGTYIFSKRKKKMVLTVRETHFSENFSAIFVQDVTALDLKQFFKHRK